MNLLRWLVGIVASMTVAEAINVIWFSGALPWQPFVKIDWTSALIKGFVLAVVVHETFGSYGGGGQSQLGDAIYVGFWVALLHACLTLSDHGSPDHVRHLLIDGVHCTLIIGAKILVMFHMRDL